MRVRPTGRLLPPEHNNVAGQKTASGALAARMAVGAVMLEALRRDRLRKQELQLQTALYDEERAQVRAARMMSVIRDTQHARAPVLLFPGDSRYGMSRGGMRLLHGGDIPVGMDSGMVRIASAMGRDLALAEGLEKEAFLRPLVNAARALPAAARGLRQGFSQARAVGPKLPGMKPVNSVGTSLSHGVQNARAAFGAQTSRLTSLQNASAPNRDRFIKSQQSRGLDPFKAPTPQLQAPQPTRVSGAQARQMGQARGQLMTPEQKRQARIDRRLGAPQHAVGSQGWLQDTAQLHQANTGGGRATNRLGAQGTPKPATQVSPAAGQVASPADAAVAHNQRQLASPGQVQAPAQAAPTGGAAGANPSLWQRSGMSGGSWKWKAPLMVGGAAGMYGLYRGAKGIANYMSQPNSPAMYGNVSTTPAMGVNEFGVPDRTL